MRAVASGTSHEPHCAAGRYLERILKKSAALVATTQDSAAEKGDDGNGAEPTAENLEKAKGKDGEMMQSWLALQAMLQRIQC